MDMLEQVLHYLHNWFPVGVYHGDYAVKDGALDLPFLQDGQYFRVMGSVFNDGLHRYGPEMEVLRDEEFSGTVWALAVPGDVVRLAEEITAWQEKYGPAAASPYLSESFGGYSYSKGTPGGQSGAASWQAAFRERLNPYRKLREI